VLLFLALSASESGDVLYLGVDRRALGQFL